MNIVISWSGIPAYATYLIRAGIKQLGRPVIVIGVNPQLPEKVAEELLGQKIIWIDSTKINSWQDLNLPVPDIFFQAGWFIPSFNKLGEEVRHNGGKVIGLIDNCWRNTLRQWLGAVKFRLFYKRWFWAVWVPGKSGTRLLRFFGVPSLRIYEGLYGANPDCFTAGPVLPQRPKQFIFVGRFVPLKNLSTVVQAFKIFHQDFPDWKILMYGDGPCLGVLENCPGVEIHPFADSPHIAEALRQSRFLVLASVRDHWPLVVAEATLAGCGLILSDRIGNRCDLLNDKNGFIFPALSVKKLSETFKEAASLTDEELMQVYEESKRLGSFYGTLQWGEKFCQIISQVGGLKV